MFGVFCYNLSMAVIKVENISKNFGALKAVDNLSFEVEAG